MKYINVCKSLRGRLLLGRWHIVSMWIYDVPWYHLPTCQPYRVRVTHQNGQVVMQLKQKHIHYIAHLHMSRVPATHGCGRVAPIQFRTRITTTITWRIKIATVDGNTDAR